MHSLHLGQKGRLPPGASVDEPFQHSIRGLSSPCTLREALSIGLDLQAPLRRPLLRALSLWCEDEREKAWMELLCSKTKAGGEGLDPRPTDANPNGSNDRVLGCGGNPSFGVRPS